MRKDIQTNDSEYGRRAIVLKQKMLFKHLEDIIRLSLNKTKSYTPATVKEFIIDVASGKESYKSAGVKHGISYNTINEWKRKGWIYEAVELGKELVQEKLDRRLTGIIDKALDNLNDQLDRGETVVSKGGTLIQKPVSAKDNALVAAIAFDKRQLVRGEATQIHEEKDTEDRLAILAEQFKKFAMKEERVIEGEIIHEAGSTESRTTGNAEEPSEQREIPG